MAGRNYIHAAVILVLVLSAGPVLAQQIDRSHLLSRWCLDKYSDEADYYKVPRIEQEDFLRFNKDMTFEARTEGEPSTGTWMLNTNGTYLELRHKDGTLEKIYILFLTSRSLVLMYDTDEYRAWEVHYTACT